ncbi:MAG: hypothetical protein U1E66_08150 [Rhodospirillales bacterium]
MMPADVLVRARPLDPERDADTPRGIFLTNGDGIQVMSIGDGCAVLVSLSLAAAIDFAGMLAASTRCSSRRRPRCTDRDTATSRLRIQRPVPNSSRMPQRSIGLNMEILLRPD